MTDEDFYKLERYFLLKTVKLGIIGRDTPVKKDAMYYKRGEFRVFPYVDFSGEGGEHSLILTKEDCFSYQMEEDELYQAAYRNTVRAHYPIIELEKLARRTVNDKIPVYVMTNPDQYYGAVPLAFPELLRKAEGILGSHFYVVPSSVHELLLIKNEGNVPFEQLVEMLKRMNKSVLTPEEKLSDSVFWYMRP